MKNLKEIIYKAGLTEVRGSVEKEITAVCLDSREVIPGSLFIAVRGTLADGHKFIDSAIEKGASAIVCEELPVKIEEQVTYIRVNDSAAALGMIAANFYDHPSGKLKLVGITGTNGKTTVATLLYKLFTDLGYKCGLISTVENRILDNSIPSTHTTPDSISLNRLLHQMVESRCDFCFMEVSSHAVAQNRILGLGFSGGVFTNITHDHLDFHKTFDEYIKAKKRFFDQLGADAFALTNVDDKRGLVMLQNTKAHKKTYSLQKMADFRSKLLENSFSGLLLSVDDTEVWFRLIGSFNAYNLLAVYATAILLEQDKASVLTSLSRLSGAEGRFDYMVSKNQIVGIVDYAHTPDAVKNVLETINDIRGGHEQVITVIGCGGDRDRSKRPVMADVACKLSTRVILTSDNPRSEDPNAIIEEMKEGVSPSDRKKMLAIADRKEAINTAVHLSKPGDIILVAGKGHEKYQEIKGVKYPFDDKEVLTEIFKLTE